MASITKNPRGIANFAAHEADPSHGFWWRGILVEGDFVGGGTEREGWISYANELRMKKEEFPRFM